MGDEETLDTEHAPSRDIIYEDSNTNPPRSSIRMPRTRSFAEQYRQTHLIPRRSPYFGTNSPRRRHVTFAGEYEPYTPETSTNPHPPTADAPFRQYQGPPSSPSGTERMWGAPANTRGVSSRPLRKPSFRTNRLDFSNILHRRSNVNTHDNL